jgi:hypothetical protein
MKKTSTRILLDYLEKREIHNLRNKIARIIWKNIYVSCGREGWPDIIAQKIIRLLKNKYYFIERF